MILQWIGEAQREDAGLHIAPGRRTLFVQSPLNFRVPGAMM